MQKPSSFRRIRTDPWAPRSYPCFVRIGLFSILFEQNGTIKTDVLSYDIMNIVSELPLHGSISVIVSNTRGVVSISRFTL